MTGASDLRVALYGGAPAPAAGAALRAGPFAATLQEAGLRSLAWNGVEILRGVQFLARDTAWGVFPLEDLAHEARADGSASVARWTFLAADGALACRVECRADDGGVRVDAFVDVLRDIDVNRVGLVALHPPATFGGRLVTVERGGGGVERRTLPAAISPAQPATDIAALTVALGALTIEIRFSGEVFEMEDQRNWTDASFKTYSRPLALPRPYAIRAGERVAQSIAVTVSGAASPPVRDDAAGVAEGAMPAMALAYEQGWRPRALSGLASLAGAELITRFRAGEREALSDAHELVAVLGGALTLEIVLPDGAEPAQALQGAADEIRAAGLSPRRVIACPEAYLDSHQPEGPWPAGPTPEDAAQAARAAFPEAEIGVGPLAYFTELNRCRPSAEIGDFVTHGTTAIVHEADDVAVMQTVEALRDVFRSGAEIAEQRAYRIGLAAIGMRQNPYGERLDPNHEQSRRVMALSDPRQRGLFAAAFAVGVVAASIGSGAQSVALGAPAGPFGIIHAPAAYAQPFYDAHAPGGAFPLFHVAASFIPFGGGAAAARWREGAVALEAWRDGRRRVWIANLSADMIAVDAPRGAASVLDQHAFEAAARDFGWRERAARAFAGGRLDLGPYAVAILDAEVGA